MADLRVLQVLSYQTQNIYDSEVVFAVRWDKNANAFLALVGPRTAVPATSVTEKEDQ